MNACSAMSSPRLSNRKRRYDDKLWSTYITEAIQSGNATQYCTDKNIPYRTYKLKLADYIKSEDTENWSPNSKRRYSHILWNTICYTAHSITNLNCIDN